VLIRFEVENYRSIASAVELSMVAVDLDRPDVVPVDLLGESLVKVAAIYGPNASGKSNVAAALVWLQDAVATSLKYWDDGIPVDPFAFGNGPGEPTAFTLDMTVEGVRFEYNLEVDGERVVAESLLHYPNKIRRKVFERDGDEVSFQRGMTKLPRARDLMTSRTLVVSLARRFEEPLVERLVQQVLDIGAVGTTLMPKREARSLDSFLFEITDSTLRWLGGNGGGSQYAPWAAGLGVPRDGRAKALALLRLADLGIENVQWERQEVASPLSSENRTVDRLRLLHKLPGASVPLDFEQESKGTRTWFHLIGPVLRALDQGSLLVFDELDASLHPALSAELIGLFKRQDTNPRGAQLLFTSHDTSLLAHLNRDEVWLTDKRDDGSTHLGSLAEFAGERVRRSQNLEKGYLGGRFGALPQVSPVEFLRALGLVG